MVFVYENVAGAENRVRGFILHLLENAVSFLSLQRRHKDRPTRRPRNYFQPLGYGGGGFFNVDIAFRRGILLFFHHSVYSISRVFITMC